MKNYHQIIKLIFVIGLLISIQFVISCSPAGYKPIANSEHYNTEELFIFDTYFEKALYKTNINIYGTNLTGLTLIKRTDSAMHVVSMSELGIKYFDIEFPDKDQQESKVHYIMELLDKKIIVDKITKEFGLMFFLPQISKSGVKVRAINKSEMLIKSKNLVYFFDQSGAITEICKQRWPLSLKPIISLSDNNLSFPKSINIDYENIAFELELVD